MECWDFLMLGARVRLGRRVGRECATSAEGILVCVGREGGGRYR